ncbi:unnamed protein product [Adineta ricciae]|uniref:ZZ-type domain-containing protein n=1 Tax=Adineta ricciae TaxID=249248 RepID=A0A815L1K9_ADIRI|nr:unnamed protein product [Adineta ricciae]CAF1597786.1 unnamed protein product [Adineta ricciae]
MSTLEDEKYGQTIFAFCDMCYVVIDAEKEKYYKCLSCKDFVVCVNCLSLTKTKHSVGHKFSCKKGLPSRLLWIQKNMGITCDRCFSRDFSGRRYRCTKCGDYDVCEKCFPHVSLCHQLKLVPNIIKARLNHKLMVRRAVAALSNPDSPFYGQPFEVVIDWPINATRRLINQREQEEEEQQQQQQTQRKKQEKKENSFIFDDILRLQEQMKELEINNKSNKKFIVKNEHETEDYLRNKRLEDFQRRQNLLKDIDLTNR